MQRLRPAELSALDGGRSQALHVLLFRVVWPFSQQEEEETLSEPCPLGGVVLYPAQGKCGSLGSWSLLLWVLLWRFGPVSLQVVVWQASIAAISP